MEIENISIEALKEYQKNNKTHPEEQIEKIKKSIEAFGFRQPILVDKENTIIAGHGRVLAARNLNLKEVPCIRVEDLSSEQVRAFRIADNKVAESEFDFDALKFEFEELGEAGFDLGLTGFDSQEREVILLNSEDLFIDGRDNVICAIPPESPKLKERIYLQFKTFEEYNRFKEKLTNEGIESIMRWMDEVS